MGRGKNIFLRKQKKRKKENRREEKGLGSGSWRVGGAHGKEKRRHKKGEKISSGEKKNTLSLLSSCTNQESTQAIDKRSKCEEPEGN